MFPITKSVSGEYMRPNHSLRKLLSRRITLDWIARVQHFSAAPHRSCVILWAQDCRGQSRLNDPLGTSTTRRSINLEHLDLPISEHGLLRLKRAIVFQQYRSNHASA